MFIKNIEVGITGRFFKTVKLRTEWYDFVKDPADFIAEFGTAGVKADLFTFLQEIHHPTPKFDFYHAADSISVIPVTTYEHWWKNQLSDKTRNMVRKAEKK